MRPASNPQHADESDVAASEVLQALASELARMEDSGRSLEGLISRLAANALAEDGVIEGLQAIDELIQSMGALSRFIDVVSQLDAHINPDVLEDALGGVKLEALRRRLSVNQASGEDADGAPVAPSGDVDMF